MDDDVDMKVMLPMTFEEADMLFVEISDMLDIWWTSGKDEEDEDWIAFDLIRRRLDVLLDYNLIRKRMEELDVSAGRCTPT